MRVSAVHAEGNSFVFNELKLALHELQFAAHCMISRICGAP
jgi:hypothetical protein